MPKSKSWKHLDSQLNLDASADMFQFRANEKGHGKTKVVTAPAPEPDLVVTDPGVMEPAPSPTPATTNDSIWTLDALEQRIFDLTNEFRVQNGKTAFQNDERLNAAADDWSMTFGERDAIGHASSAQVKEYGYDPIAWSENIAWGFGGSAETVVNAWINSPGHRAAMLGNYEEMGVGVHYVQNDGGNESWSWYYTQEFGTEADMLI